MAPKRALVAKGTKRGKRLVVDCGVNVKKNATFDTHIFNNPDLAWRFSLHFANRHVITSRNIDFSWLCYLKFNLLFANMR